MKDLTPKLKDLTPKLDRPQPIAANEIDVIPYKRRTNPKIAVDALIDGYFVLIADFYSSGLNVLRALKEHLSMIHSDQSFQGQRNFRSAFRELSHRLIVEVYNHKLTVRKAPVIGWFHMLYPELDRFLLPFPQVQGLNSAWQWYEKGIFIPVLNKKIHPYFGTYFPTRFEHLKLFDTWLNQYKGEKKSAFDIGIGSGVLSLQMLKHGFEKVYGTDSNPNAIIGLSHYLNENKPSLNIDLTHGDLFANHDFKSDLIVFNPPWLPASYNSEGMDKAIYYDETLFPRFFTEAKRHLNTDGRVVLLFSNLARITKVGESHPIEAELFSEARFQKDVFLQKKVGLASKNTRRNQNWRTTEMVELWVLKLIDTE
ncbi:methyltransferase [bacterium]|nr:methyltransferase [bacterium]